MIGESVSHYRVTDELGRGGMGVVYRAEDEKLDRTIALKVLPPQALHSEEDRARFYREARAAAALSHPNIAHIYEIDEAVTAGESRPFIAMEFIDGETLSDRIAKKPVAIKDALSIATQIAEGLKAAHEKNIVHRDIKGGNVMLTKDGVAKILDFGLAKTAASTKLTQMGSTLGTFAYMSPEQARGEEVDGRSDIWSLGVVLYEMITGQLPFPGEYEQAIVYGILNEDPESLTSLRAGVPMALDGVIGKLLAKDPALRYQHVDELPADLKAIDLGSVGHRSRILTSSASIATAPAAARAVNASASRTLSRATLAGALAVSAVLGALVVWLAGGLRQAGPNMEPVYLNLNLEQMALEGRPDWSPVGTRVLYTMTGPTGSSLAEYDLVSGSTRSIPGSSGGTSGRYSGDGQTITFRKGTDLFRIAVGATQSVFVSDSVSSNWVDWFSSTEVIFARATEILRHDLAKDRIEVVVPEDSARSGLFATTLSPSANHLFFSRQSGYGLTSYVRDLRTGSERELQRGIYPLKVSNSGFLVYFAVGTNSVMARPINLRTAEFEGSAVAITSVINPREIAISESGNLLYRPLPADATLDIEPMYWVDSQGNVDVIGMIDATEANDFVLAQDGKTSVIEARIEEGVFTLFSFDLVTKSAVRLLPESVLSSPALSGDGRMVYFDQIDDGNGRIRRVPLDGLRNAEDIVTTEFDDRKPSVSDDENLLVFQRSLPSTGWDIWSMDLDTRTEEAMVVAAGDQMDPDISPDGRLIAFQSVVGDQSSILVGEVAGSEFIEVATAVQNPQWSFGGDAIYFSDLDRQTVFRASVVSQPRLRVDVPQVAFGGPISSHIHFAPAPGDMSLLVSFIGGASSSTNQPDWTVVLNWTAELERKVPRTSR